MKKALLTLLILVSLNSYGQHFTIIDSLPEGAYGAAAWGDFDNDGYKDLVYLTQAVPNPICIVYHNIHDTFVEVAQAFPPLYNPAAKWADLDNDGFDDLVLSGMDTTFINRTYIYKSNGDGTFTSMPNNIAHLTASAIDIMDYNNDGLKDIAIMGWDSVATNRAYIYKNNGSFNFTDIHASLPGAHFGEIKWGDYNNDSLPDLVLTGGGSGIDFVAALFKNMGADSFQQQPVPLRPVEGTVDFVDYDKDGKLDIFITGYDTVNSTTFYHNNGDGTFTIDSTDIPAFGEPSAVAVADFDHDGYPDFCLMGGTTFDSHYSAIAYGHGIAATYTVDTFFPGYIDNVIVETADMDNDGDYDIFFNNLIIRNDDTVASTGVGNVHPINSVIIYPNPASDELRISSGVPITLVNMYDAGGRLVKHEYVDDKQIIMSLDELNSGIYLVEVRCADRTLELKKVSVEK